MRIYLIDPIAQTVTAAHVDQDGDDFHDVLELLDAEHFHLTSSRLNPKADEDIDADNILGDFCYSGTFFGDVDRADFTDSAQLEQLFTKYWGCIAGDPRKWFQIDTDRPAPATFPVSTRAIVVGVTGDGMWTDAQMPLGELKRRVTFLRGRLSKMTLRDDLEKGTTWVGPVVSVEEVPAET